MKNRKYQILLLLFLISLASASILVYQDLKPTSFICDTGEGCDIVRNSEYNKLFFGVNNEYLGFVFFSVLIILTIFQIRKPQKIQKTLITLGIIGSFTFALYSIYLQEFVINAYCKYCTTMDISIFISFLVLMYSEKEKLKKWLKIKV